MLTHTTAFEQRLGVYSCGALQATLFHQLGMTKADFRKLVTSRRSNGLLQLRVPTIRNKLQFLKEEIGLDNEEVRKLLVKCPRILEHKLESTMRPHLEFLQLHGVAKEDIAKVCTIRLAQRLVQLFDLCYMLVWLCHIRTATRLLCAIFVTQECSCNDSSKQRAAIIMLIMWSSIM